MRFEERFATGCRFSEAATYHREIAPATLQLACAANTAYAPHAAAMLHSALENGGVPLHVHFLHSPRFSRQSGERIRKMLAAHGAKITMYEVPDSAIAGLPTRTMDPATWYRILLAELLHDISTVLYLDVDTIVTSSLVGLRDFDLGNNYVGAATNVFMSWHEGHTEEIGMDPGLTYFNAGVSLFNLDRMRRDEAPAALREFGLSHPEACVFYDQDALNMVLGGSRAPLHPRWNCTLALRLFAEQAVATFGSELRDEALRDPAIMHWEGPGPNKPWHLLCDPADRRLYRRHAAQTPWRWVKTEGLTPRNLARLAGRRGRDLVGSGRFSA